jgi:hypothetical protein
VAVAGQRVAMQAQRLSRLHERIVRLAR